MEKQTPHWVHPQCGKRERERERRVNEERVRERDVYLLYKDDTLESVTEMARKRKKRERDVNQNAYVAPDDLLQSEINTHRTDRFRLSKSVKIPHPQRHFLTWRATGLRRDEMRWSRPKMSGNMKERHTLTPSAANNSLRNSTFLYFPRTKPTMRPCCGWRCVCVCVCVFRVRA